MTYKIKIIEVHEKAHRAQKSIEFLLETITDLLRELRSNEELEVETMDALRAEDRMIFAACGDLINYKEFLRWL